jgi:eukaryotic-like serine/threonine-protein kinase
LEGEPLEKQVGMMRTMGTTRREDEQILQLKQLIGSKYEILRRLGGGGMGQVVLARHRDLGGLFAIKILADHLAQDPRIVSRFRQEAKTAASLEGHPNIVSVVDTGEGDGLHYFIMQFIAGEDMGSYLRREGALTPPTAADIIAQAAGALEWAKERGVVHRDLKPSNLQLDVAGRIHILDFGISKTVDLADGLTRPGESMGTPHYMSPEQIHGEVCDARSDLYSLGVIFFEFLSGRRPFDNESVTAIQNAHLYSPAPSLLELAPQLPPMWDEIVQRLLRKDRNKRYQSPQELLNDLYKHGASSGPTSLRPQLNSELQTTIEQQTIVEPVPPPPKRYPVLAVTLIVLALALAAVAGYRWRQSRPPSPTVQDDHGVMLLVPPGAFVFGENAADSPHPRQTVTLASFYIDQTEVSNVEYLRFIKATGRSFSGQIYASSHPNEPVTNVSYQDAVAYAAWAGKRLPTDQEWEKAARGTDGRPYPWGFDAWKENVPTQLQPVDSFPDRKSPYGAFNMAGNSWEWTATPYTPDERELADMRNVLNTDSFSRTWQNIKGGSFSPNGSFFFRLYLTRGFPEDQTSRLVGFRCAKNAP